MITAILILALIVEIQWSPRLEYIKESDILICHYSKRLTRKYFVVWKF